MKLSMLLRLQRSKSTVLSKFSGRTKASVKYKKRVFSYTHTAVISLISTLTEAEFSYATNIFHSLFTLIFTSFELCFVGRMKSVCKNFMRLSRANKKSTCFLRMKSTTFGLECVLEWFALTFLKIYKMKFD